jgi:hypothetical protein
MVSIVSNTRYIGVHTGLHEDLHVGGAAGSSGVAVGKVRQAAMFEM